MNLIPQSKFLIIKAAHKFILYALLTTEILHPAITLFSKMHTSTQTQPLQVAVPSSGS